MCELKCCLLQLSSEVSTSTSLFQNNSSSEDFHNGLLGDDGDNVYLTLDPQYHPIQPDKTCPQSVTIYNEHKDLAKEYLQIQREIQIMSQHMESLAERLNETENYSDPEEEEREVRKLEQEKENLLQLHQNLKRQLEIIKKNKQKLNSRSTSSSSGSGGGEGGWMVHPHPT